MIAELRAAAEALRDLATLTAIESDLLVARANATRLLRRAVAACAASPLRPLFARLLEVTAKLIERDALLTAEQRHLAFQPEELGGIAEELFDAASKAELREETGARLG